MSTQIRVAVPAAIDKLVGVLEAEQPLTKGELCARSGLTDLEVNVALDRAQTDERVTRRVIAGRVVFHLPHWVQPRPTPRKQQDTLEAAAGIAPATVAPTQPPEAEPQASAAIAPTADTPEAPASVSAQPEPPPSISGISTTDALVFVSLIHAGPEGRRLGRIVQLTELPEVRVKRALVLLRERKLVELHGSKAGATWHLTDRGRTAATEAGIETNAPTDSQQPPRRKDVQPIDMSASNIDGSKSRADSIRPVISPAGPRDGLNASALAAEQSAPDQVPVSARIEQAEFGLWSDGRLEIDAGDIHLTLTPAVVKRLATYLDHTCSLVLPEQP